MVIVTGAGGFIGAALCRGLRSRGTEFVGIVRPGSVVGPSPDAIHPTDLSDPTAVRQMVAKFRPTTIFNLAAAGVRRQDHDSVTTLVALNVMLPIVLAEEMPRDCTLIHVGSMWQYRPTDGLLREDDSELDYSTPYVCTKNAADHLLRIAAEHSDRRCVRARMFGVVGMGEAPDRLLPTIVRASKARVGIPLTTGDQVRDVLHVSDAADALIHVSATGALVGQAINIGRGEGWSVRQIAEKAADELGCADQLHFGVRQRPTFEGGRFVADATKLFASGWRPQYTLAESISLGVRELAGA